MANVLRLGDRVTCRLMWGSQGFPAIVRSFKGHDVRVEADPPSSDPEIENWFTVPFSWLSTRD
jgi:hypothetical protein